MPTKTLFIVTTFFLFTTFFAQKITDNSLIKNLTTWANPKKDSIKALKLHEIITYEIKGNDKKIDSKTEYNKDGYVLMDRNYFFKYNSSNELISVKFSDQSYSNPLAVYDSTDLTKDLDTTQLFRDLSQLNTIFYIKSMQDVFKVRKEMRGFYDDSIKLCDGTFARFNSKTKQEIDCSRENRVVHRNRNVTYIYHFGYDPPTIEIITEDQSQKRTTTCSYSPSNYTNKDKTSFDGYNLTSRYTRIVHSDFDEDIYEYFVDENEEKTKDFPVKTDYTKIYPDKTEYYYYKATSAKNKILKSFYTLKTETTYYK